MVFNFFFVFITIVLTRQYAERAESPANSYASMQSDSLSETREEREPSSTQ